MTIGPDMSNEAAAEPAEPQARVVDAINTKKKPPPETKEAILRRRWVILSFWTVVALLGLPVWWKTTNIYRADLPLQEMIDWADGKVGSSYCNEASLALTASSRSAGRCFPFV